MLLHTGLLPLGRRMGLRLAGLQYQPQLRMAFGLRMWLGMRRELRLRGPGLRLQQLRALALLPAVSGKIIFIPNIYYETPGAVPGVVFVRSLGAQCLRPASL